MKAQTIEQIERDGMLITIEEAGEGNRMVSIDSEAGAFVSVREWCTAYPLELIRHVLDTKGPAHLCDEIMREEAPDYLRRVLMGALLSFVEEHRFRDARFLDFGCGSGASSVVLARMFPGIREIVGVDLEQSLVELARHRTRLFGLDHRITPLTSPGPTALPDGLGEFDYIVMSAVYEHLCPDERRRLMPILWSHLRPGGTLFLNQTPYRWFPVELHTTGIPFLNYMPDNVALRAARLLSRRVKASETWEDLLRRGIRGGTIGEIQATLSQSGQSPEILSPSGEGVRNGIDLWQRLHGGGRAVAAKRALAVGLRVLHALTGISAEPTLTLAVRKPAQTRRSTGSAPSPKVL